MTTSMKIFITPVVASSLLSLIFSQQIFAASLGQFYAGVELDSSRVLRDGSQHDPAFIPNQEFKASDSGYGIYAGFQFNDWFAVELGFNDFGRASHRFKFRDDVFLLKQPNDTQTLDAKGTSLSGVFSYKINSNFSLLGTVGVVSIDYDLTQSGGFSPFTGSLSKRGDFSEQGLVYGLGAKYTLNDSLDLRAQVRRNEAGDFTLDVASLGVEYSF